MKMRLLPRSASQSLINTRVMGNKHYISDTYINKNQPHQLHADYIYLFYYYYIIIIFNNNNNNKNDNKRDDKHFIAKN